MTLNHAAHLLTATITVVSMVGFVLTGSLTMGLMVLVAPLPSMWVQHSERQTWSLGEVLRGRRDDHTVADALDQAIRGPLPSRPVSDDSFFVPGVPRLDPRHLTETLPAPETAPPTPPASTPLR